jgi:hypothetical protein
MTMLVIASLPSFVAVSAGAAASEVQTGDPSQARGMQ